ncbi:MAG: alkaline phosphatase family protein [Planctomycetes bacterium]|nr:alkaline phosphatase family protein [Planctomycetota bacterium]
MTIQSFPPLPLVLAGPLLRLVEPHRLVLWLAVREPVAVRVVLDCGAGDGWALWVAPGEAGCRCISAGEGLHYLLLELALEPALPVGSLIGYGLWLRPLADPQGEWQGWDSWAADLCYPGREMPCFRVPERIDALLHGSCRKPHHAPGDGLAQADRLLGRILDAGDGDADLPAWPSLLVLSGDQIYADDVAGPMLRAIHQLIGRLGLPDEPLPGTDAGPLASAADMYAHPRGYYGRETLLPRREGRRDLIDILFGGVEKPIFTSDTAHNHLITLGEVLAMYLLVWSPACWAGVDLRPPSGLGDAALRQYAEERVAVEEFAGYLSAVRRVLAHLPTAMIFDDHDITDDWNLSREWEDVVYGQPFSRRVIGNALIGYLINQAWGNRPETFGDAVMERLSEVLTAPGGEGHDACIEELLRFEQWHYEWCTTPPLVVIDSRTRRWRSESSAERPSGLMDWEALTDLQHRLRDLPAVLLVSPAPIFGVKLIEAIQRVFTWFGKPLMVDAENWMAHPGAAAVIINIFRHRKTPERFVILSGDVHYSFVYDVELRGRGHSPRIWQICSSGLRNEFPPRLLTTLDHLNRWLYSPRSPLNWFTLRRRMRVSPRKPEGTPHGRRLLEGSSIGLVELDEMGAPWRIRELLADGRLAEFSRREAESRWE